METVAILGGGSWGTALALLLARGERCPKQLRLWVHDRALAATLRERRVNEVYLPGFELPAAVEVTTDLRQATAGADLVIGVMPSAHAREIYTAVLEGVKDPPPFLSATKGIEPERLLRMSEVVEEVAKVETGKPARVAVLSGPSFAREVARGDPIAVVAASRDLELARQVQELFSGPTFRVYTNQDVVGVEMGGAVKNIIAIAAGICVGLGFGQSTLAALITRGAAEISRLACALGADPRTPAGLSGIGDLVLTATGALSRNRSVGIELGRGRKLDEILRSTRMVAEGVGTTAAVREMARRGGVEMPITEQMYAALYEGRAPREAIRELMQRRLREE